MVRTRHEARISLKSRKAARQAVPVRRRWSLRPTRMEAFSAMAGQPTENAGKRRYNRIEMPRARTKNAGWRGLGEAPAARYRSGMRESPGIAIAAPVGKGVPLAVARRSVAIVHGHGNELRLREGVDPDGCGQQASREDGKRSEDWVEQAFHRVTPGLLNGCLPCRRRPAGTQRGSRPFGCSAAEEWIGYVRRPRECFPHMCRVARAYR